MPPCKGFDGQAACAAFGFKEKDSDMCEAHAYIIKDGKEEMLLENVDQLDFDDGEVRMINIFGEQKILKARIKSYNASNNRIVLEALE